VSSETCTFLQRDPQLAPPPGAVVIRLSNGTPCWVDAADAAVLRGFRWHFMPGRTTNYAYRKDGRNTVYMHRQLTGLAGGRERVVDHWDGNGLNNTRANLRIATNTQNQANGGRRKNSGSDNPYRGVKVTRRSGGMRSYRAYIRHRGVDRNLGTFATAEAAARAYDAENRKLNGAFAKMNFPAITEESRCPNCGGNLDEPSMANGCEHGSEGRHV